MDRPNSLAASRARPTAFREFYDAHAASLLRFFVRRTLDPDAAADLTAETFAQAYAARAQFRGRTDEEAAGWLYAIARRRLARFREQGVVERRALERLGLERPVLNDEDLERIERLADLGSLRTAVARALEELTPEARAVVQLRVVDERSYREIAAELKITEQAARARVSRALKVLMQAAPGLEVTAWAS